MATTDTWICPGCGRELKVGVSGCPECQPKPKQRKKRQTKPAPRSWEQDETYDGLDLPDEDFDYDEFVEREVDPRPHKRVGVAWYWWATALVLVIVKAWSVGLFG